MATSIWKWESVNGAASYYAYGALQQTKEVKFYLHMKGYKWGRKWMLRIGQAVIEVP